MEGVSQASVTIDDRTVAVSFDESSVDLASIITAIEDQGYEVAT